MLAASGLTDSKLGLFSRSLVDFLTLRVELQNKGIDDCRADTLTGHVLRETPNQIWVVLKIEKKLQFYILCQLLLGAWCSLYVQSPMVYDKGHLIKGRRDYQMPSK